MSKNSRIILVDDHPIVVEGMRRLINSHRSFEVIGTANSVEKAIATLPHLNVDLAIIDMNLGDGSGLDVVDFLKSNHPEIKTIILTMYRDTALVRAAINKGVDGYILKDEAIQTIHQCLEKVLNNEKYISPNISDSLSQKSILDQLTRAESKIIKLIAKGHSTKEMAELLFISPKTITNHRTNIARKLKLDGSSSSLIKWAIQHKQEVEGGPTL